MKECQPIVNYKLVGLQFLTTQGDFVGLDYRGGREGGGGQQMYQELVIIQHLVISFNGVLAMYVHVPGPSKPFLILIILDWKTTKKHMEK